MLPYFQKLKGIRAGVKDELFMLPFLYDIAKSSGDPAATRRIITLFHSLFPEEASRIGSEFAIEALSARVHEMIDEGLSEISDGEPLVFGFSSKFHQWIPAMVMAKKLKALHPQVKTVVGGFGRSQGAAAVLRACPDFDFSVWGEGEYPLFGLCEALERRPFDPEAVPRLIRRQGNEILETPARGKILSLENSAPPDFEDMFEMAGDKAAALQFPLESSRGCHWKRCKFCSFAAGSKYRRKPVSKIVEEIEELHSSRGVDSFRFVDTNAVGPSIEQFEELLDAIIASREKTGGSYKFYAEIMPVGFSKRVVEKLAAAGFSEVQIGYEAITDDLLKKADKRSDFADLVLFIKFARKLGISILGANIIRGMVEETEEDVAESIANLSYLRFFLARKPDGFWHNLTELRLQGGTRFLEMVDPPNRSRWKYNPVWYLLPGAVAGAFERFELFDFTRELEHKIEWERFERVNAFYEGAGMTYKLSPRDGDVLIEEFIGGNPQKKTVLAPEAWDVLGSCNEEVRSLDELLDDLKSRRPSLAMDSLSGIVADLGARRLLYSNSEMTRIVAVVDTVLDTRPNSLQPS